MKFAEKTHLSHMTEFLTFPHQIQGFPICLKIYQPHMVHQEDSLVVLKPRIVIIQ